MADDRVQAVGAKRLDSVWFCKPADAKNRRSEDKASDQENTSDWSEKALITEAGLADKTKRQNQTWSLCEDDTEDAEPEKRAEPTCCHRWCGKEPAEHRQKRPEPWVTERHLKNRLARKLSGALVAHFQWTVRHCVNQSLTRDGPQAGGVRRLLGRCTERSRFASNVPSSFVTFQRGVPFE